MTFLKTDWFIRLTVVALGLVFCLFADAKENKTEFLREIESVKGAIVPQEKELDIPVHVQQPTSPAQENRDESLLPESEIPVLKEKKSAASETQSTGTRLFLTVGILAAFGIGTFLFIRRNSKPIANSSMQIKVLTQHHLGPRKSLAIIRVAGESILIGVTEQNISMIKSLALLDEDLPEITENQFSETMKKVGFAQSEKVDDEFSIHGIRDMVSKKLKNMKNLES